MSFNSNLEQIDELYEKKPDWCTYECATFVGGNIVAGGNCDG